jgi:hypothetical protein
MRRLTLLPLLIAAASFPLLASVDTALLALVPPGAKIVSGIDFDRARNSEFGQFMTARMNITDHDFDQFIHDTGFDPRRDLQQVLFASAGPGQSGGSPRFAVLARGNFDQEHIATTAKTKGVTSQSFQGVALFIDKSQANGPNAFAFLGQGVGVMGDLETVKQIISNRGTATVLDSALQAEVQRVSADNDAWFVSSVSGGFLANHLNAQINGGASPSHDTAAPAFPQAQILESVLQSSGGLQFGSSIRFSFDAITRSPQDATSLADVVRFFASMVQMSRQKDPRADMAASAFDNMNLKTDGDAMHLSISFPEKSLEQMVESSKPSGASPAHHTQ